MSALTTEDKMKCRLCKKEMEWRVTGLCSECEAKHPDIGGVVVGLTTELLPVIQKYDKKEGRYRRWLIKVLKNTEGLNTIEAWTFSCMYPTMML
jgi:hypothetical protein